MKPQRHTVLVEKAIQAAVSAIEIYNKPAFLYREETFAILMLNAWELLLKARILKEHRNDLRSIEERSPVIRKDGSPSKRLVPKRNRSGNNVTIGLYRCATLVRGYAKDGIDEPCFENIGLLVEIRDNAIHFHNMGKGLRKRVQEIGAAAIRNFAYASKTWFLRDLAKYDFALLPFAFESPAGVLQTVFSDEPKGAAGKVQSHLTDRFQAFPFDATKPFNVGVEVELRFVRKPGSTGIPVRIAPDDPSAMPVVINEDDMLRNYPWRFVDLRKKLRDRYVDFKENEVFHRIRKPLEAEKRYCIVRQLDPKQRNSPKQKFYNPNIVAEFDKHYLRRT